MGKLPGKLIKAKLFGKKSAKSVASKKGEAAKEAFIICKASSGVVAASEPVISNPVPVVTERNVHNLASGNQTVAKPLEESVLLSGSQDGGVTSAGLTSIDNSDTLNQEQAAAKVQAAVRGFLARRAFWALKGIIRLQALIRGHLVKRQAVATLHCMRGIVRFQARVRGQKGRRSEAGIEVKEKCNLEKLQLITVGILQSNRPVKLSNNIFAQKLLALSPDAMPLSLHYDSDDANSAWNWLERWSISHFWELVVEVKRDKASKFSRKSGANKDLEMENGKPKRGNRRNSSAHHDNSTDYGKPRVTSKKSISHPPQENGPSELEKVKRNLRKVSLTKSKSNAKPEFLIEKPKCKVSKFSRKSGANKDVKMENYGKPRVTAKKSISHPAQENGPSELEKVKRNLRKVSLPEALIEKPKSKVSKIRDSVNSTIPDQLANGSTDSFLNEKHNEPSDMTPAENGSNTSCTSIKEHDAAITLAPQRAAEEILLTAVDKPSTEALEILTTVLKTHQPSYQAICKLQNPLKLSLKRKGPQG